MAFNDTLFQLGMDLTRSSTAQKEESIGTAHIAHNNDEDRKDFFIERDGVRFAGTTSSSTCSAPVSSMTSSTSSGR